MSRYPLTFKPIGKAALLIEWPNRIEETILDDIISLQQKLESSLGEILIETVNAYNSLTLVLKSSPASFADLESKVRAIHESGEDHKTKKKLWKLPVCYEEEFSIDLKEIADIKKLSVDQIINLHCLPEYIIYFIGFLPGFLYLGGLSEKLHVPRRATPRLRIVRGAVAIGGQQTGIYPLDSPGGWNIIGNSPLQFFDPTNRPPCFASAGDHLKFYPVTKKEHQQIKERVEKGVFHLEYENL